MVQCVIFHYDSWLWILECVWLGIEGISSANLGWLNLIHRLMLVSVKSQILHYDCLITLKTLWSLSGAFGYNMLIPIFRMNSSASIRSANVLFSQYWNSVGSLPKVYFWILFFITVCICVTLQYTKFDYSKLCWKVSSRNMTMVYLLTFSSVWKNIWKKHK